MWLLDANIDVHLAEVLRSFGIACDTAGRRGWGALENGKLVTAAVESGFTCLLTRDRLFAESAAQALRAHPGFSVVIVQLPQRPWGDYQEVFLKAWEAEAIAPVPGTLTRWP